jgi:hypothetical protein
MTAARVLDLDLDVTSFGKTGMLKAKGRQMPNLMVVGTDAADLLDCVQPVVASLLEAGGEAVTRMSVTDGPHVIRVRVELAERQ